MSPKQETLFFDSYWIFQSPILYLPAKVRGWQTYREVRFAVPPKTGCIEYISFAKN